jgi:hypothetical protein
MKIQASNTSRKRQFSEIVKKHCPDFIGQYKYVDNSQELLSLQFLHNKHVEFEIPCTPHYSQFRGFFHDSWENLEFNVLNPNCLEQVIKIGNEYEKLSDKKVIVVKKY